MGQATVQAGFHPSKRVVAIISGLLTVSLAFICAALSGHSAGWLYYQRKNYSYYLFNLFPLIKPKGPLTLKIWVGYVRSTTSIRIFMNRIGPIHYWEYLWEVATIGAVIGWLEAAVLIVGFFASLGLLVLLLKELVANRGTEAGKMTWPRFAPLRIVWIFSAVYSAVLFLLTCFFYAISAIGVVQKTQKELGEKCVAWPDWCWWLTIITAVLWAVVAVLARKEHKRQRVGAAAVAMVPDSAAVGGV